MNEINNPQTTSISSTATSHNSLSTSHLANISTTSSHNDLANIVPSRLLVIANRLPLSMSVKRNSSNASAASEITFTQSSGGLVSALAGSGLKSIWIGWPGGEVKQSQDRVIVRNKLKDLNAVPVFLAADLCERFYNGFCNDLLWPLFHYNPLSIDSLKAHDVNYKAYQRANAEFARVVLDHYQPGDLVWVHDYHLMLLPSLLRQVAPDMKIGFFLHTPFPSSEIYRVIPSRADLLQGVLGANLLGFHTHDYARHFASSATRIIGAQCTNETIKFNDHISTITTCPIGIDPQKFLAALQSQTVKDYLQDLKQQFSGRHVLLGIDRLDYIKGIPQKLHAFELFLTRYPEFVGKVVLVQIAVPSRSEVPEYQRLKTTAHQLIGSINGKYSSLTTVPIIYLDQSIPFDKMCAMFSIADALVVTSLRDGMNLVAYEYIACQQEHHGVLIISEFAGAAQSLGAGALQINPNNYSEVSDAIHKALTMTAIERKQMTEYSFAHVMTHTAKTWATEFVDELERLALEKETSLLHSSSVNDLQRLTIGETNTTTNTAKSNNNRPVLLDMDHICQRFIQSKHRLIITGLAGIHLRAKSSQSQVGVTNVNSHEQEFHSPHLNGTHRILSTPSNWSEYTDDIFELQESYSNINCNTPATSNISHDSTGNNTLLSQHQDTRMMNEQIIDSLSPNTASTLLSGPSRYRVGQFTRRPSSSTLLWNEKRNALDRQTIEELHDETSVNLLQAGDLVLAHQNEDVSASGNAITLPRMTNADTVIAPSSSSFSSGTSASVSNTNFDSNSMDANYNKEDGNSTKTNEAKVASQISTLNTATPNESMSSSITIEELKQSIVALANDPNTIYFVLTSRTRQWCDALFNSIHHMPHNLWIGAENGYFFKHSSSASQKANNDSNHFNPEISGNTRANVTSAEIDASHDSNDGMAKQNINPNATNGSTGTSFAQLPWQLMYENVNFNWFDGVLKVMNYFCERTPRSYIQVQETNLSWHYELAETVFATRQALDLITHLTGGPLTNTSTEIIHSSHIVQVRPLAVSKGRALKHLLRAVARQSTVSDSNITDNHTSRSRKSSVDLSSEASISTETSSSSLIFPTSMEKENEQSIVSSPSVHATPDKSKLQPQINASPFDFILCIGNFLDKDENIFELLNDWSAFGSMPAALQSEVHGHTHVHGQSFRATPATQLRQLLINTSPLSASHSSNVMESGDTLASDASPHSISANFSNSGNNFQELISPSTSDKESISSQSSTLSSSPSIFTIAVGENRASKARFCLPNLSSVNLLIVKMAKTLPADEEERTKQLSKR